MFVKRLLAGLLITFAVVIMSCSSLDKEKKEAVPEASKTTPTVQKFIRPDFSPTHNDTRSLFLSNSLPIEWEVRQPFRTFTERWEAGEYQGEIYYTWKTLASEKYTLYKSISDRRCMVGADLTITIFNGRNAAKSYYESMLKYSSQYVRDRRPSFSVGDTLSSASIAWKVYRQDNNTWSFLYTTNVVGQLVMRGGLMSAQEVLDTTKTWMEMLAKKLDAALPRHRL